MAIIPAGSNEQHGPHLLLKHDIASALYVSIKVAEEVYPMALVTPPISIGFSPFHMKFTGSLSLRAETLINLSLDIHRSLKRDGIKKVVTVNGHGGNEKPLHLAARIAMDEFGLTTAFLNCWDVIPRDVANIIEERGRPSGEWGVPGHAGEFETAMGLVMYPEKVRTEFIPEEYVDRLPFPSYQRFLLRSGTEYSKTGVHSGDPTLATPEKGKKFIDAAVKGLVSFLVSFIEYGDEIPPQSDK